jgi:hypothetical protein
MYIRNIINKKSIAILIPIVIIISILISGCSNLNSMDAVKKNSNSGVSNQALSASGKEFMVENILPANLPESGTANRPIAVMVENSFAARPQSGLNMADVVYEVVDEYGITRFVAIFSSNDASMVGPVRSARTYYAEIARAFDPIYSFFGTYPECYGYIEQLGMNVLSAMSDRSGNSSITAQAPYWRDWTRSDIQEHTAFMSIPQLRQKAAQLGYPLQNGGIPFPYKTDPPLEARGGVSNIHIDFSTQAYAPRGFDIRYIYDRGSNSYSRFMGGSSHIDYNTGQQIMVKNIVVMVSDILGPLDKWGHMSVRTAGSGIAFIFQDGNAVKGSWERGSVYDPFIYRDSSGKQISFTGGSTWVAIISGTEKVSFQ